MYATIMSFLNLSSMIGSQVLLTRGEDEHDPARVVETLVKIAVKMSQQHDRCPGLDIMKVVVRSSRSSSAAMMVVSWQHCKSVYHWRRLPSSA